MPVTIKSEGAEGKIESPDFHTYASDADAQLQLRAPMAVADVDSLTLVNEHKSDG